MSGVQWQPRERGSGGPGYLQAVAPSGTYARYQAFMDHSMLCEDCEYGEIRCATAKGLWAAYVRRRDAAA
ncbi:hypothetical protein [Streptomyces neyagawaensis]|uniref:hypothetical protein n=1 Tax=Streptomyces neyagawaensis TaxID=42238 RepID=UPI0006E2DFBA|nr:hypothetical protein [Streptomyces neyagawaensis]MCL6734360.1 hypothetical protein [Streptomyces neyagawaensis]MDE1681989.1 hypothetical protein [Streptomyces neyagawaensis]